MKEYENESCGGQLTGSSQIKIYRCCYVATKRGTNSLTMIPYMTVML